MITQIILVILLLSGMCTVLSFLYRYGKRHNNYIWHHYVCIIMFIVYICGVIFFTFIYGGRDKLSVIDLKYHFPIYYAVIRGSYGAAHLSILNILLFFPLGFLLPQLFASHSYNWWKVIFTGFGTTLLIEVLQPLVHRGAFELDDLLKNTLGCAIGYLFYKVLIRRKDESSIDIQ